MTVAARLVRRLQLPVVLGLACLVLAGCGQSNRQASGGGGGTGKSNQLGYENGMAPQGEGLSTFSTVLIFVLAPLVILLVTSALVWLPGMARGNRYRPSKGWTASPLWFGGPPDPAAAVETAQTGELTRGGASGSW